LERRERQSSPSNFKLRHYPKERLAFSLLGLKAEAEGGLGIAALVAIAALLFTAEWLGFV
jgi:hypothetical protein